MAGGGEPRGTSRARWRREVAALVGALAMSVGCQSNLEQFVGYSRGAHTDPGRMDAAGFTDASVDAGRALLGDSGLDANVESPMRQDAAGIHAFEGGAGLVDAQVEGGIDATARNQDWPFTEVRETQPRDGGDEVPVDDGVAIQLDGDVTEWVNSSWLDLAYRTDFGAVIGKRTELAAVCAWREWRGHLFLAVVVRDDVHDNSRGGYDIWKGDSVQVAFDVDQGRLPYDWEYGFALVGGEVTVHRWLASDAQLTAKFPAAVRRWGDITVYEVQFAPGNVQLDAFEGAALGVSVALNESDEGERTLALELAPGIVQSEKSKAGFVRLTW